jgi:histidine triad (HIT) family protein
MKKLPAGPNKKPNHTSLQGVFMPSDPNCIFCKIASGHIPAQIVHEDEELLAFKDIHPKAPLHLLIIPRAHIISLQDVDASHAQILGKMLVLAPKLARENGSPDGFRTIINTGRVGGQEVYHLHVHVLGGPAPVGRMI